MIDFKAENPNSSKEEEEEEAQEEEGNNRWQQSPKCSSPGARVESLCE